MYGTLSHWVSGGGDREWEWQLPRPDKPGAGSPTGGAAVLSTNMSVEGSGTSIKSAAWSLAGSATSLSVRSTDSNAKA